MAKSARRIIRIEPDQDAQFQRAAKSAGKSVSEWLRDLGAAAVAAPVRLSYPSRSPFDKFDPSDPYDIMVSQGLTPEQAKEKYPAKFCENPNCPVGCPDSHTLPSCDEDAIAMGVPITRISGDLTPEEMEALAKGVYTFPVVEMSREEFRKRYPDIPRPHTKEEIEHGLVVGRGYVRLAEEATPKIYDDNITLVSPDGETRRKIRINSDVEESISAIRRVEGLPALSPELDAIAEEIAGRAMESLGFKRSDHESLVSRRKDAEFRLADLNEVLEANPTLKKKVHEIAAGIPGLMVGLGAPGTGRGLFNPEHPIPLTGYAEKIEARLKELKSSPSRIDQLMGTTVAQPEILGRIHEVDGKTISQTWMRQPDGSAKLISEYEVDESEEEPIELPADTPEEPVRSWSEEFAKFRKLGDFGADALAEATEHIKKWPKGFKTWNEQKQVAWLDEKYPLTDTKGDGW